MTEPCCDYRDHHTICTCACHERPPTMNVGEPISAEAALWLARRSMILDYLNGQQPVDQGHNKRLADALLLVVRRFAAEELEAEAAYDDAAPDEQYARYLFANRLRVRAANLRADALADEAQLSVEGVGVGEDWSDPTPEQIAACAAYDPDPEQYGTANR